MSKKGKLMKLDDYDVVNRRHRLLEKEFGPMPVVARKMGAGSEKNLSETEYGKGVLST